MKLDTLRKIDIFLQGLNVCCIIASVICGCYGVSRCLEAGNINAAARLLIISGALVSVPMIYLGAKVSWLLSDTRQRMIDEQDS